MYYTPPSHEEPIRTNVSPLTYYRLTYAPSLLRINGQWKAMRSPSSYVVQGHIEGIDYFIGGHEYDISEDLFNELTNSGFPSDPEPPFHPDPNEPYPGNPGDPGNPGTEDYVYGMGLYGDGPYGGGVGAGSGSSYFGSGAYGAGPYGGN